MDYIIMMDVSGDIDREVAKENNLCFIPMEYSVGNEIRCCEGPESEETLKSFYEGQRKEDFTKTSQISPYKYEAVLRSIFEEGKSVLYLCLSSGLSSTYQSACVAKQNMMEEYPDCNFYPVDTLAATGGMGVLAERAIRNRSKGMSIEENYEDLVKASKKVKHWFVVEDLMYLKRGGRISASTAVLGTALNIKPILNVNQEGKLQTVTKKRGDKASLAELISMFDADYDAASGDVIYIVHADSQQKAESINKQLKEKYPGSEVRICGLSPIIGAHTGPGMAAVCFMGK